MTYRSKQFYLLPGVSELHSLINNITTPIFDDIRNIALHPFSPVKLDLLEKQHPRVNSYSKNGNLIIDLFVPYYTKDDVGVETDNTNNIVTVTAQATQDKEVAEKDYYLRQVSRGGFRRMFQIDKEYDIDKLTAELNDGILHLVIPPVKRHDEVKSKKVKIL
jgi:HSP20 family protein